MNKIPRLFLIIIFQCMSLFLFAQGATVDVKGGKLKVIDGVWGTGPALTYKGKQTLSSGEHTFEVIFTGMSMSTSAIYQVKFDLERDKFYEIVQQGDSLIVLEKENYIQTEFKNIKTPIDVTKIVKVGKKKGLETRLTEETDLSKVAVLSYTHKSKLVGVGNNMTFTLWKIDDLWGTNTFFNHSSVTGATIGSFKIILSPGVHTLYSQSSSSNAYTSLIQEKINEISFDFVAGKEYYIDFENWNIYEAYIKESK